MAQVLSTAQVWFDWVFSKPREKGKENLTWNNGWRISFWFFVNRGWSRMSEPTSLNLREAEALWDPNDPFFQYTHK